MLCVNQLEGKKAEWIEECALSTGPVGLAPSIWSLREVEHYPHSAHQEGFVLPLATALRIVPVIAGAQTESSLARKPGQLAGRLLGQIFCFAVLHSQPALPPCELCDHLQFCTRGCKYCPEEHGLYRSIAVYPQIQKWYPEARELNNNQS